MTDPLMPAFCCKKSNTWTRFYDMVLQLDSPAYNSICLLSATFGILGAAYQVWITQKLLIIVERMQLSNLKEFIFIMVHLFLRKCFTIFLQFTCTHQLLLYSSAQICSYNYFIAVSLHCAYLSFIMSLQRRKKIQQKNYTSC